MSLEFLEWWFQNMVQSEAAKAGLWYWVWTCNRSACETGGWDLWFRSLSVPRWKSVWRIWITQPSMKLQKNDSTHFNLCHSGLLQVKYIDYILICMLFSFVYKLNIPESMTRKYEPICIAICWSRPRSGREDGLHQRALKQGFGLPCKVSYRTLPMKTSSDDNTPDLVSWPFLLPEDFDP